MKFFLFSLLASVFFSGCAGLRPYYGVELEQTINGQKISTVNRLAGEIHFSGIGEYATVAVFQIDGNGPVTKVMSGFSAPFMLPDFGEHEVTGKVYLVDFLGRPGQLVGYVRQTFRVSAVSRNNLAPGYWWKVAVRGRPLERGGIRF